MTTIDESAGRSLPAGTGSSGSSASGGMADVWLAEDQELGRKVAIKMLHERYANDMQFVERFRREATHAAGLSHPNVVSIYDRGEAEGSYFIVMEYVEGRTLKELIIDARAVPRDRSRSPTSARCSLRSDTRTGTASSTGTSSRTTSSSTTRAASRWRTSGLRAPAPAR